ncbi:hypothetical protein L6R52_27310 [Myxococcota bacterium]|nr:hypothetical protein [Myxococcota bacterium]
MKARARETTAEWITERLIAILSSYPKDDVAGTMPVILLYMTREFGFDQLQPELQGAILRMLDKAGVREDMAPADVAARVERYIDTLDVNERLLFQVQEVFLTHDAARAETTRASFRDLGGDRKRPALPAFFGSKRPEGSLTLDQLCPRRRM